MSGPALKRKGPEPRLRGPANDEQKVLAAITSKKDLAIWTNDIKNETKLPDNIVKKAINSLLAKELIKEVVNIKKKGKKHYMGVEFEPSKEVSGGAFYTDGVLDQGLIDVLHQLSRRYIGSNGVGTVGGAHGHLVKNGVVKFAISAEQVGDILNSMALDGELVEVKSTGYGDYYSIPVGTTCYRLPLGGGGGARGGPGSGAFAPIPCAMCPRTSLCTSDGEISPSTCVYFAKWLDISF